MRDAAWNGDDVALLDGVDLASSIFDPRISPADEARGSLTVPPTISCARPSST